MIQLKEQDENLPNGYARIVKITSGDKYEI